ncbi:MAG: SH3 domain-containing protein [Lewinella sp.]|nr:SH3 domain-containing protein [Lewinella sp.]
MRTCLALITLILLGTSCGTDTSPEAGSEPLPAVASVQQRDSLREAYLTYYAQMPDTFPQRCRPEAGRLNPADEAPRDTAFFVFREYMREVVAERDIFKLLPLIDQDIKIGFGAENGLADFIRMWDLTEPEKVTQSRIWTTLEDILGLGGAFSNGGNGRYFEAPYLGPCWPDDVDPFEYGAITGAGVRLRSAPSLQSQIVKVMSYDIVAYLETTSVEMALNGRNRPWIKVKTLDGLEGYVYGQFYRSSTDFRAAFSPDGAGNWRMVTLLAGD